VSGRVSAVIVSFNTREDLLRCLGSLLPIPRDLLDEVLVVDNASSDDSVEAVRERYPEVRVIANPQNAGFARANNQGLRETHGELVLFLNSDAELRPGALQALVSALDRRPELGLVGPRTLNSDGTVQVSYGPLLTPLAEWRQRRRVRAVSRRDPAALRRLEAEGRRDGSPDWLSGSCLLARREALSAVGGFDEAFFLYEEDVDLCLRLRRAGWEIAYVAAAEVVHHLGRSSAGQPTRAGLEYHRSHLLYYRKHNGPLLTGLLRLLLGARAALGLFGSLGKGPAAFESRRHNARLWRLAWRGPRDRQDV